MGGLVGGPGWGGQTGGWQGCNIGAWDREEDRRRIGLAIVRDM